MGTAMDTRPAMPPRTLGAELGAQLETQLEVQLEAQLEAETDTFLTLPSGYHEGTGHPADCSLWGQLLPTWVHTLTSL